LLTLLLFVYSASTLEWPRVAAGAGLALAIIAGRFVSKLVCVAGFARVSGITWRKGLLTGVGLTPVSVFAVLLLEHARQAGVSFGDALSVLAGVTLMLDLIGPIVVQRALAWARETQRDAT